MLSFIPLVFLAASANAQGACGYTDVACLAKAAQYTIVGTVVTSGLNSPGASPYNYYATINVQCVLSSFSNPVLSGSGLVGQNITVANFGTNIKDCPPGAGSTAVVGFPFFYFIDIAVPAAYGSSPSTALFEVQDICAGGVGYSNDKLQAISNLLASNPSNAISKAFSGSSALCQLPAASTAIGVFTPSTSAVSQPTTVAINANDGTAVKSSISEALWTTFGVFASFFLW